MVYYSNRNRKTAKIQRNASSNLNRTERTGGNLAVSGNQMPGEVMPSPGEVVLNSDFPGQTPEGVWGTESPRFVPSFVVSPGGQGAKPPQGYLEHLANVSKSEATLKLEKKGKEGEENSEQSERHGFSSQSLGSPGEMPGEQSGEQQYCSPGYFIRGVCENGHSFAKELLCGREWCPVCGQDDSTAHMRRVARWLPKAQQMATMGYFVFTIPEHTRYLYRTKKKLSLLTKKLIAGDTKLHMPGLLKSMGFERGLCRWHWFGDESETFNPHLNVIVEAGHLPKSKLAEIKRAWAGILGVDMADVHYSYTRQPGKMFHILKYVTRATFHVLQWDEYLAAHIYNFRNMRAWGKWDDLPVWECTEKEKLAGVSELESGVCPECGTPISWAGKPLLMAFLKVWAGAGMAKPLGAGYWRLPDD